MLIDYMNELITYIRANPVLTIGFTLVSTILVLLYKETKNNILTDLKLTIEDITNKLIAYGRIESSILAYLKYNTPEYERDIYEVVGQSAAVISDRIRKVYLDNTKNDSSNYLLLLTLIQSEILNLRKILSEKKEEEKIDSFEKIIARVITPTKPILYLLFFSFVIFACIVLWNQSNNWFYKVNVICFGYSFFFGVMVFIMLIKEFIDGVLITNRSKKFIVFSTIISLTPIISMFITYVSFAVILLQIFLFLLLINSINTKKKLEVVQVDNNFR